MGFLFPEFGDFFVGYGSYHNNIVNKVIHLICIPLILSSFLGMLMHAEIKVIDNPFSTNYLFELNIPFFFVALNIFAYLNVELLTGILSACLYFSHWLLNNYLYHYAQQNNLNSLHLKIAIAVHAVCWILQFIGHGVFEKRRPALLDNILYTLVAPDFVVIEILFELGYKKDVFESCKKRILQNIKEFQEGKEAAKKSS